MCHRRRADITRDCKGEIEIVLLCVGQRGTGLKVDPLRGVPLGVNGDACQVACTVVDEAEAFVCEALVDGVKSLWAASAREAGITLSS